ncbi:chemotaxis protein CheA [Anaeromyxobacter diazotrophicus]|uniref:histidine kinase n=1 Tax=Anaeromyxobacter diazotrophicus TaxID=2590199 RepID=A0A7I9VLU3_9BACT|nr:chemotaxis protein CheW [Anaeromyxobacter diazotrophicus]GEJ57100.1 hypothetical protein AMYX_18410 [Anaeromyxobacter diazotrophicus]
MTGRVDLGEFVAAFLVEAEELLRAASSQLLAVEAEAKQGRARPRAVREAFRATHTLKGLAAMVGQEPIVGLAHRMEAVLRTADAAGGRLDPAALDVLLRGVRELERQVSAVGKGGAAPEPPRALVERLQGLEEEAPAAAAAAPARLDLDPALAAKLSGYERDQLLAALGEGRRALRVDFTPSPARAAEGLNITTVRERVAGVAEIVKVLPRSVPASDEAPGGIAFALLLVAAGSDEEVAAAAGVAPSALLPIGRTRGEAAPPQHAPELELELPEVAAGAGVVRVEVARLDEALEGLSALVVTRSRLRGAAARLAERGADVRELDGVLAEAGRQLRDVRRAFLRVRMVRVTEVLDRLPLLVRGLQRATGKRVRLEMDAGEAELDKGVAERLFPALVHLVRNAVDHGLEDAAGRRAAGKPEEGAITVSCFERSTSQLELTVADDGAGIDREAVARRAGAPPPETDAALLDLLCRPGLSTRPAASTTSGRGMGMDIVRRVVVEELGGELSLRTVRGQGSAFTLRVPLTISIVDAFSLVAGGQRYVVPVSAVEEILELDRARVVEGPSPGRGRGVGLVERRGEAVPLLDLCAALGAPRAGPPAGQALLVRRGGDPVAFAVDKMVGQQEVVLRPLLDPLVRRTGVAAATDLGDGRPTLVLDLVALGGAALTAGPGEAIA